MSNRVNGYGLATALGIIAVLGMLSNVFGATWYDGLLGTPWDGGSHELEIVEVLPYFFWFAVWFGLLVSRQAVALALCSPRCVCAAVAGAIVGHALFRAAVGDLT